MLFSGLSGVIGKAQSWAEQQWTQRLVQVSVYAAILFFVLSSVDLIDIVDKQLTTMLGVKIGKDGTRALHALTFGLFLYIGIVFILDPFVKRVVNGQVVEGQQGPTISPGDTVQLLSEPTGNDDPLFGLYSNQRYIVANTTTKTFVSIENLDGTFQADKFYKVGKGGQVDDGWGEGQTIIADDTVQLLEESTDINDPLFGLSLNQPYIVAATTTKTFVSIVNWDGTFQADKFYKVTDEGTDEVTDEGTDEVTDEGTDEGPKSNPEDTEHKPVPSPQNMGKCNANQLILLGCTQEEEKDGSNVWICSPDSLDPLSYNKQTICAAGK